MKILIVHNDYLQHGGEETVVAEDERILSGAGHEVSVLRVSSTDLKQMSLGERIRFALTFPFQSHGRTLVEGRLREFDPDLVHLHNLYPMIGLAGLGAAVDSRAAVVMTVHNYRLSCMRGTHYKDGHHCERCHPSAHTAGIINRCYRGSGWLSLMMARAIDRQWRILLSPDCPVHIAYLTEFARDYYRGWGMPSDKVGVCSNFSGKSGAASAERRGVLFVGRLAAEKGIRRIVAAWPGEGPSLTVVGDGPQLAEIEAARRPNVTIRGRCSPWEVQQELGKACCTIVPSEWMEGMPMSVIESFAASTPAVGYDSGSVGEMLRSGRQTVVPPRDERALIEAAVGIAGMWPSTEWHELSAAAESEYQLKYSEARGLGSLLALYSIAIQSRSRGASD